MHLENNKFAAVAIADFLCTSMKQPASLCVLLWHPKYTSIYGAQVHIISHLTTISTTGKLYLIQNNGHSVRHDYNLVKLVNVKVF